MSDESPSRISVSRDALRAELAEMELRLRFYFDDQLRHKADSGPVVELALKVDALDRGDFTDVHRRALTEFVEGLTAARTDRAWTGKERLMAVLSTTVTLAALLLSVLVALHGGVIL